VIGRHFAGDLAGTKIENKLNYKESLVFTMDHMKTCPKYIIKLNSIMEKKLK
jgi:hypothetical protein